MPTDDPIADLFKCEMLDAFKSALALKNALSAAYFERTGLVLQRDTEYTVEDMRRASRILRSEGVKLRGNKDLTKSLLFPRGGA